MPLGITTPAEMRRSGCSSGIGAPDCIAAACCAAAWAAACAACAMPTAVPATALVGPWPVKDPKPVAWRRPRGECTRRIWLPAPGSGAAAAAAAAAAPARRAATRSLCLAKALAERATLLLRSPALLSIGRRPPRGAREDTAESLVGCTVGVPGTALDGIEGLPLPGSGLGSLAGRRTAPASLLGPRVPVPLPRPTDPSSATSALPTFVWPPAEAGTGETVPTFARALLEPLGPSSPAPPVLPVFPARQGPLPPFPGVPLPLLRLCRSSSCISCSVSSRMFSCRRHSPRVCWAVTCISCTMVVRFSTWVSRARTWLLSSVF